MGATGRGVAALIGAPVPTGVRAHPAIKPSEQAIIASPCPALRQGMPCRYMKRFVMWVIYLEALVAVTLVLFIVWWTMGGKK